MLYYITKTGLDAFDTARAWGLGVVLNVMTGDDVKITDANWAYIIKPVSSVPPSVSFSGNAAWTNLFQQGNWKQVFVTSIRDWTNKREDVRNVIEREINSLLDDLQDPANTVQFGKGESLPGGLDPSGFKGLRHATRAKYQEGQLNVPEDHWALACLGMATCGIYRRTESRRGQRPDEYLALLPVPERASFSDFRDMQELFTKGSDLQYHGVQNAAAHYAVQLAEHLRRRAAAQGSLQDRYSAVLYFRLMKPAKSTANWKPAQGNQLRLDPLMDAIDRDPHRTEFMLRWLDYCFRLGSRKGAEDLAFAATELVMRWDLDAYDSLVRVAVRILGRQQVRKKNPGEFDAFLQGTRTESIQSTMGVMSYAAI